MSSQSELCRSREHTPPPTLMSSPPVPIPKVKKKPTVTPRTFRRFFTPRTSLERVKRASTTRQVLSDITGAGANRAYRLGKRRTPQKDDVKIFEDNTLGKDSPVQRKRITRPSEASSPSKRQKGLSYEVKLEQDAEFLTSEDEECNALRRKVLHFPLPIVKSAFSRTLGSVLRRELDLPMQPTKRCKLDYVSDWQAELANFCTRNEDEHVTANVVNAPPSHVVPFCAASCNTNSLLAIGDEEGGVRLLETNCQSKPSFRKAYLSFRPHANAIMDLAFSPDDSLLATACGDQTSQVIDMRTQRAKAVLSGHVSTVKVVRFQPGSSNNSVLATCSRDGSIQIWDLRCKGSASTTIKVSLDGIESHRATTWTTSSPPPNAATVNRFPMAHSSGYTTADRSTNTTVQKLETSILTRRFTPSITSMSFISSSRPHLLVTGSEGNATVKLWDIRTQHASCRGDSTPLSMTQEPDAHIRHRQFGLTSLALNEDASRIYTLCRDNTVYAYSTNHLILGSAPELSLNFGLSNRRTRQLRPEKQGLGPIYGLRHTRLKVSTFYVKLSVRHARYSNTELIAVGSSDSCAVVFPTNECHLQYLAPCSQSSSSVTSSQMSIASQQRIEGSFSAPTGQPSTSTSTIPIYNHGVALARGHEKEVTGVSWTHNGDLASVGDDYRVRLWRESRSRASQLRTEGEHGGKRWGKGWAEFDKNGEMDWDQRD